MKKIFVLGAFDRFNYGDLLFPLIIENQFKKAKSKIEFDYFGLVESDFQKFGGKKTKSLSVLHQLCENNTQDEIYIIVAGGETLTASWSYLYSCVNKYFSVFTKLKKLIPNRIFNLNNIAKKIIQGNTDFPFVFDKEDFNSINGIIYNALGGSSLQNLNSRDKEIVYNKLTNIEYLSVRDKYTHDLLLAQNIKSNLVPDSAILISKIFRKELYTSSSTELIDFLNKEKGKYLFFQINYSTFIKYEDILIRQLEQIGKTHQITICLCPIGRALKHNDMNALRPIYSRLSTSKIIFDELTLWEIMTLVANSNCYIGTSLHGAITAMSFAVPYIGLNKNHKKLDNYLKTWGASGINETINIEELSIHYQKVIGICKCELQKKRDEQITKYEDSFNKIIALIDT